jgi:hypothetical protein
MFPDFYLLHLGLTRLCFLRVFNIVHSIGQCDRNCGLVVKVHGYIFRGPGSIPSHTRFSEK